MHPIAVRILAGEQVCPSEVNIANAQTNMDWVRDTDRHHAREGCKNKNCVHAPGAMTVDWAATLVSEAAHICTCGQHGANDPDIARKIVRKFHGRW